MDDKVTPAVPFGGADEGAELRLRLTLAAGRIAALHIDNRRPAALLDVLRGYHADAVPDLVRRLFPICGSAHALACARAIAAARGDASHVDASTQRDLLWAELAVAHGWRSLIDWRALLGQSPRTRELRQLIDAAARLRAVRPSDPQSPLARSERADALRDLAAHLQLAVFGESAPRATHAAVLCEWVGTTANPLRDLLDAIRESPLASVRPPDARLLAMPSAEWFAQRLSADPEFGRQPSADGVPAEVGAYADCAAGERRIFDTAGALGARLLAMLAAAATLIAALRDAALGTQPPMPTNAVPMAPDSGCAVVATVRGPLAYWVQLDGERIAGLRSVAPTEWALHPRGSLSQVLVGLPAEGAQRMVRLAAAVFDPCAVLGVEMEHMTHA